MEIRLWGPVELAGGGTVVAVRPPQQAAVLAALAVDAGRQVPDETLLGRIWDGEPPAQARRTVHTYLTRIRRLLEQAGGSQHGVRLTHRGGGYLLDTGSAVVDLATFRRLVAAARQAGRSAEQQFSLYAEALLCCRGEPLAGVPGGWAAQVREGCRQQRLDAVLGWAGAALSCGRAAETVAPLGDLVGEHPLAESPVVALMRALQATGRSADALDRYAEARRRLAGQLGIDPGPHLRAAHRDVLSGGTQTPPGPPARVPAQLPRDLPGFVGRAAAVAELDAAARQPGEVPLVALSGTAGVGKTALAVHWAHRRRAAFPAGQLYVDLRGYAAGAPMRPVEALARFLHALGVPAAEVPADEEIAAGTYRSLVADRRMLVILDNAASAEQVRPLLPAGAGSFVLVTSRERLDGLVAREGARRLVLDVLRPEESRALITRTLGAARLSAAPPAVDRLARLCAHLPLALRIATAHLLTRPDEGIDGYTRQLGPRERVGALRIEDDEQTAVRFAFDRSYLTLPEPLRRPFRLLGLAPGTDLTAAAAAALAGVDATAAASLLDRLAAAHLLQQHLPGRYAFHDLLRLYAAGHAEAQDSGPDRDAAVLRLLDWQLATAEAAVRLLYPELRRDETGPPPTAVFTDRGSALSWLDAERANLAGAARHAAAHGPHRIAWQFAEALRTYFWNSGDAVAWQAMTEAGLAAAETAGDLPAQVRMRLNTGALCWRQDRYDPAAGHYRSALELARRIGRTDLESSALSNLGAVLRQAGRLTEAIAPMREALLLAGGSGRPQPGHIGRLGSVLWELGRLREAADLHAQALTGYEELGSPGGRAVALANLGETLLLLGETGPAAEHLGGAVRLYREMGNRDGEAEALCGLAVTHSHSGRTGAGFELATEALAVARDLGRVRSVAGALCAVGTVHLHAGRPADAAAAYTEALGLAREIDHRFPEAEALAGLAAARLLLGAAEPALALADQARAIAGRAGYRVLEIGARETMSGAHAALGRPGPADEQARLVRELRAETGFALPAAVAVPAVAARAG